MAETFLSQIMLFAGNYAPENFAKCDGTAMPISSNDALYSLVGTTYGGDGVTNFKLPDLRGRIPVGMGQNPQGSNYPQGAAFGVESVTLTSAQMPQHSHAWAVSKTATTSASPNNTYLAASEGYNAYTATAPAAQLSPTMIGSVGGNQAHTNMMPFMAITFVMALAGNYPSRF